MSNKNIFQQDAEIPDIVQQKANLALAQIYARQDKESADKRTVVEAMPKHIKAEKNTSSKRVAKTPIVKLITTSIAAVVTVAAVVVAIMYFTGKGIGGVDNRFTIKVCAAELGSGRVLPMSENADDKSFSHGEDWYGNVDYAIEMPITVEGDNIESVSYKVNNGCFQVVSIDCPSIVSAGQVNSDPHAATTFDEGYDTAGQYLGSTIVEYYDYFSMDYDDVKGSAFALNIVNSLTDRMDLYYLLGYPVSDEVTDAALTYMVKDTVVTVEVRFKDGTVTATELGLLAKQYSDQDVTEDGTSFNYSVSGFFCYEIAGADEETTKYIEEQIACVEDYISTYNLNDGKTGPDSHIPEFSSNVFDLPGFDEMTQLEIINSGARLSKSGKDYYMVPGEADESGFYNVVLRYGDVTQEVAQSVNVIDNVIVERDADTAFVILILRKQDGAAYSVVYEMNAQGISEYAEYDGAKYSYPDLK